MAKLRFNMNDNALFSSCSSRQGRLLIAVQRRWRDNQSSALICLTEEELLNSHRIFSAFLSHVISIKNIRAFNHEEISCNDITCALSVGAAES